MASMSTATALQRESLTEVLFSEIPLPLVVEILPGQAGEGLIDIYEPGSYEEMSLRELVYKTLSRKNWSIEEKQILDDIHRQLSGGKLLVRGREISGTALEYAIVERTDGGENYLYLSVRAIKPQEGGTEDFSFSFQDLAQMLVHRA